MFSHVARQTSSRHIRQQLTKGIQYHQPSIAASVSLATDLTYNTLNNNNKKNLRRHFNTKIGGPVRNFSVTDYPVANDEARALKTTFDLFDPNSCANGNGPKQLTKIVATIGPTSEQLEPLQKVVKAGMKIMRLNFSHATKEEVELRLKNLSLSQVGYVTCISCWPSPSSFGVVW
jgi:hypothetical protein